MRFHPLTFGLALSSVSLLVFPASAVAQTGSADLLKEPSQQSNEQQGSLDNLMDVYHRLNLNRGTMSEFNQRQESIIDSEASRWQSTQQQRLQELQNSQTPPGAEATVSGDGSEDPLSDPAADAVTPEL